MVNTRFDRRKVVGLVDIWYNLKSKINKLVLLKQKHMKRKYILALLLVVVIGFGGVLFSRTEMLQGKLTIKKAPDYIIYSWLDQFVSPVASPVPSVVVSEVPSDVPSEVPSSEGPSIIISQVPSLVPSVVVSPVSSPVAINARAAKRVNPKKVKKLTAKILEDFAKKDFKKNPEKYSLSSKEKAKLLKLYEMKSKK